MQPSPVPAEACYKQSAETRRLAFKRAVIIEGTSNCEVTCVVRTQNDGGACVSVSAEARVPSQFIPYVPIDGVACRSLLRWRRSDAADLQLHGVEAKPRTQYG